MLKVELIHKPPLNFSLIATAFYDEAPLETLPPEVAQALEKKPHIEAVEAAISRQGELITYLAARLKNKSEATRHTREMAGAALNKRLDEHNATSLLLDIRHLGDEGLDLLAGLILSSYRFLRYKRTKASSLQIIQLLADNTPSIKSALAKTLAMLEGVYYARDLTSEPPNMLPPLAYAKRLQELESLGIKVEILRKQELEKLGMNALLAVSKGSAQEPAVAVLQWTGCQNPRAPIALVGKGVCFDSGGICLKPPGQQYEMKWDKAGAGVVAGLMKALALAKAPQQVIGVLGLVENMPDGSAAKTGDVISTMSGKTVEIADTDAEGRLVLADCMWYVQQRFNPRSIIDLGTLTIETIASLGTAYAALYTEDQELAAQLKAAGQRTGDLLWQLPMGPYFAKQIESPVADIKNVGLNLCGENAAAAEFLKCFIKDGQTVSWAHLDIAGVSWTKEDHPLCPKGVTGFGVRLLADWLIMHYV